MQICEWFCAATSVERLLTYDVQICGWESDLYALTCHNLCGRYRWLLAVLGCWWMDSKRSLDAVIRPLRVFFLASESSTDRACHRQVFRTIHSRQIQLPQRSMGSSGVSMDQCGPCRSDRLAGAQLPRDSSTSASLRRSAFRWTGPDPLSMSTRASDLFLYMLAFAFPKRLHWVEFRLVRFDRKFGESTESICSSYPELRRPRAISVDYADSC